MSLKTVIVVSASSEPMKAPSWAIPPKIRWTSLTPPIVAAGARHCRPTSE